MFFSLFCNELGSDNYNLCATGIFRSCIYSSEELEAWQCLEEEKKVIITGDSDEGK